jgi:2-dehydropantoate 2-reductase
VLGHPAGRQLIADLMFEVGRVAGADGYPIPADYVRFSMETTDTMPDYVPSTALDLVRGKKPEIDALLGNVLKVAKRHNVETPRLGVVMALLALMSSRAAPPAVP